MFDLWKQSFIYYGKNNHSSSPIHAAEVVHTTINLQEVRKFMQCAFVHKRMSIIYVTLQQEVGGLKMVTKCDKEEKGQLTQSDITCTKTIRHA